MITEPLKLGTAQTVAVVFRTNLELVKRWGINENGRQLVNFNGPPHLVLGINDERHLVSRNYTGFLTNDEGKRKYVLVGRMGSPQEINDQPVVALSVYDPSINTSRLYLNGVLADEAKAPELETTESPRYIGSHRFLQNTNFLGDIGELMIYDTGLANQEAIKLSKSLMEKFNMPFQASQE